MDYCSPAQVKSLCAEFGFQFTKSLGQNFLISPEIVERIADSAGLDAETAVLEIGPGFGALTNALSARAKQVVALELDQSLFPVLAKTLADRANVRLVQGDALQADYRALLADCGCSRLAAAANLPYYITTKSILRLLRARLFDRVTVMIQREAAGKLVCSPGSENWCLFSLLARHYADIRLLFTVPRSCFYPQPKVESAVLTFEPRLPLSEAAETKFSAIAEAVFAMRRKTLGNCLKSMPEVLAKLTACGIDAARRGESLTVSEAESLALAAAGEHIS